MVETACTAGFPPSGQQGLHSAQLLQGVGAGAGSTSREQGASSKEQGEGSREQGAGSREQETGSREL